VSTVRTEYEEKITKIKAEKKPIITSKINLGKPNGGTTKLKIPEDSS
jgi:hypothetical protein